MRIEGLVGTNPADNRYLEMIRDVYEHINPEDFRAAVAYATHSGVAELETALRPLAGWQEANKRWLVGIDYCRSDPVALTHLNNIPRSAVRIFDGEFVSRRTGCIPRNSYHPKAYLLQGTERCATVVGSGNLSRTGLRLGIEAAAAVSGRMGSAIDEMRTWFADHWENAIPFDNIQEQYQQQYESRENRRHPIPIEEDATPESASNRRQISPDDLRKLRVCRYLWIEAGNLHLNRGPGRPGNQLMLKRNSRVFFGFPARDLARDTAIGSIAVGFVERWREACPLRFSNNSMDVLTLPVPGTEGPEKYDQQTLLFERVGVRRFNLTISRGGNAAKWRKRSGSIKGEFKMTSGRRWGVF